MLAGDGTFSSVAAANCEGSTFTVAQRQQGTRQETLPGMATMTSPRCGDHGGRSAIKKRESGRAAFPWVIKELVFLPGPAMPAVLAVPAPVVRPREEDSLANAGIDLRGQLEEPLAVGLGAHGLPCSHLGLLGLEARPQWKAMY